MNAYQQFLASLNEALTMAHQALTKDVTQEEKDLAAAMVMIRIGNVNREIERVSK